MKKLFIAGALLLVSVSAYSESNKAVYKRLYQDSVMTDHRVNGDPQKAKKLMRCHMKALAVFPSSMQRTAFQVAGSTQSYEEAQKAFYQATVAEVSAGGERKSAFEALVVQSQQIGDACMAEKLDN